MSTNQSHRNDPSWLAELATAIGRELTNLVQGGGGLLGTLIAIYGRLRAEGPLIRKRLSVRL